MTFPVFGSRWHLGSPTSRPVPGPGGIVPRTGPARSASFLPVHLRRTPTAAPPPRNRPTRQPPMGRHWGAERRREKCAFHPIGRGTSIHPPVADIADRHPMISVIHLFEGKQYQHEIDGAREPHPPLAPGPYLSAHVLDRPDTLWSVSYLVSLFISLFPLPISPGRWCQGMRPETASRSQSTNAPGSRQNLSQATFRTVWTGSAVVGVTSRHPISSTPLRA